VAYALENARFQWEEGERRVRRADDQERANLERALEDVLDGLRRRLGSSFAVTELAELYGEGTDWADDIARRRAGSDTTAVVDAAFNRYAREAHDFAGGKQRIDDPNRRGRLPSQDY
jgi:hypothetical protein